VPTRLIVIGSSLAILVAGLAVVEFLLPHPQMCVAIWCGDDFDPGAARLFGWWFTWPQVAVLAAAVLLALAGILWGVWPRPSPRHLAK
jgi:hypothetical protein